MKAKFDFYEIARVNSLGRLKRFHGLECTIIGRGQSEETNQWSYAINVGNEPSCAFEYELEKTGRFSNPEDHKSVGSVRVRVKLDGSGEIVEDE